MLNKVRAGGAGDRPKLFPAAAPSPVARRKIRASQRLISGRLSRRGRELCGGVTAGVSVEENSEDRSSA